MKSNVTLATMICACDKKFLHEIIITITACYQYTYSYMKLMRTKYSPLFMVFKSSLLCCCPKSDDTSLSHYFFLQLYN